MTEKLKERQLKDIEKILQKQLAKIKGETSADSYYYGYCDGVNWLYLYHLKPLLEDILEPKVP